MTCRQYVQAKTGQDLPKEGAESALDEILGSYKTELGLSDKESEQLEHLQVSSHPVTIQVFHWEFSTFHDW